MTDAADFDAFYAATSRRLLQYAFAMSGDLTTAQDLVQEAYVRAWQRWSQVSRYDSTEHWLRRVVARLATDRWRHLGVRRRFLAAARPAEPVPPPADDTVLLVRALRQLPRQQRDAIALHYLLDMPIVDVAAECGVPVGTVKSWLSRGRVRLAELLNPDPSVLSPEDHHAP